MTVVEISLVAIALSVVVMTVMAVTTLRRIDRRSRRAMRLMRETRRTMRRLNRVAANLESVTGDVSRLTGAVAGVVGGAGLPLGRLLALATGLRTGLATLLRRDHHDGDGNAAAPKVRGAAGESKADDNPAERKGGEIP
jgi:hypothetical protein